MIIHTHNIVKNLGIKHLKEKEDISNVVRGGEKIKFILSKRKMTTKDMYKKINLSPRAIRKCLSKLEEKKEVKRIKGKEINKKVRHSDSWILNLKNIIKKVPRNKIFAYYRNEHHNKGYRQHYMFLPKKIILNEDFISAIGFFDAEGSKTHPRTIEVVNSEPRLINLFIKFFNYFNITKENISYRIIFNRKLPNLLKNSKENINSNSIKFWKNHIKIPDDKKIKINYVGKLKGKSKKNIIKYGSLNINYHNVLFRNLFFNLIKESKIQMEKENELIAYLRGYFCGEAYVGKSDRSIQVASKDLNQLEFAKNALEKIGVSSSISKKTSTAPPRIIITNLKGFLILENKNIFKFHQNKKMNLITKILNYKKLDKSIRTKLNKKLSLIKPIY